MPSKTASYLVHLQLEPKRSRLCLQLRAKRQRIIAVVWIDHGWSPKADRVPVQSIKSHEVDVACAKPSHIEPTIDPRRYSSAKPVHVVPKVLPYVEDPVRSEIRDPGLGEWPATFDGGQYHVQQLPCTAELTVPVRSQTAEPDSETFLP